MRRRVQIFKVNRANLEITIVGYGGWGQLRKIFKKSLKWVEWLKTNSRLVIINLESYKDLCHIVTYGNNQLPLCR